MGPRSPRPCAAAPFGASQSNIFARRAAPLIPLLQIHFAAGGAGASPQLDKVRTHDQFNLVAITALNLCNFYYLATDKLFHEFWVATLVYFL